MDKSILIQYSDLQEEIKEVRLRIEKTQEELDKMDEKGFSVIDSVKGGYGGNQHFKIEGFPYPEYSRKKTLLYSRKATLTALEMDLLEMTNSVDEYIATVQDSKMRRILTMSYIDNMSQKQIGDILHYDRSSISKKISDFFAES